MRLTVRVARLVSLALAASTAACGDEAPPDDTASPLVFVDDGETLACAPLDTATAGAPPRDFTACGVRMDAWAPVETDAAAQIELEPIGRWSAAIDENRVFASDMARVYVVDRDTGDRLSSARPPGVPTEVVAGGGIVGVELPSAFWLASVEGDALVGRAIYTVAEEQPEELSEYWWRGGVRLMAADEGILAIETPGGLAWLDVSDPLSPSELGCVPQSLDPNGARTWFADADAERAVVVVDTGALRKISVVRRETLEETLILETEVSEFEPPAWVEGNRVLVGTSDGLELHDISSATPRRIGLLELGRGFSGYAGPPLGGFVLFAGAYDETTLRSQVRAVDLRADSPELWTGSVSAEVFECSIVLTSPDGSRQVELGQGVPLPDRFEPVRGFACSDSGILPGGSALVTLDRTGVLWMRDGGYSSLTLDAESPFESAAELADRVDEVGLNDVAAITSAGLLIVHASDGGDWGIPSSGALEFRTLEGNESERIELPGRPIDWSVTGDTVWMVVEREPTIYGDEAPETPDWVLARVVFEGTAGSRSYELFEGSSETPPVRIASNWRGDVFVLHLDGTLSVRSAETDSPVRLETGVDVDIVGDETSARTTWMLATADAAYIQTRHELVGVSVDGEVRRFGACNGARLVDATDSFVYVAVPLAAGGRSTPSVATIARAAPRQVEDGSWILDVDGRVAAPDAVRALEAQRRGVITTFGETAVVLGETLEIATW